VKRPRVALVTLVAALAAGAAWPFVVAERTNSAVASGEPTPAAVNRDYLTRDAQIAFWEHAAGQHLHGDFLTPRNLAEQYMQRFRERGDIGDVGRALAMALQEERVVPHSGLADASMIGPLITLHRFRQAREYVRDMGGPASRSAETLAREASLDMELGEYEGVPRLLGLIKPAERSSIIAETVESRYDELTGKLNRARYLLARAMVSYDAHYPEASAQARAWYHFRAGELAFAAGQNDEAIADERLAIEMFPNFNLAYNALARFELATGHPREALEAATSGANITPLPEVLGYKADAERSLGMTEASTQTRDLIVAIEQIGNAYHVNDRLIAIYYSEHGIRLDDGLRIARREIAVRGDEVYAQDTLAWAAAMDGHRGEARSAMAKAVRYDTDDPRLQFHAGMIALHFGDTADAKLRLSRALALNPQFHPVYADEARLVLASLDSRPDSHPAQP
jgi:tetratricopeptide (TPR) repeat protein